MSTTALQTAFTKNMQISSDYLKTESPNDAEKFCNYAYLYAKQLADPDLKLRCRKLFVHIFQQSGDNTNKVKYQKKIEKSNAKSSESTQENSQYENITSLYLAAKNDLDAFFQLKECAQDNLSTLLAYDSLVMQARQNLSELASNNYIDSDPSLPSSIASSKQSTSTSSSVSCDFKVELTSEQERQLDEELIALWKMPKHDNTEFSDRSTCTDSTSSGYSSPEERSITPMTDSEAKRRLRQLLEEMDESSEEDCSGVDAFEANLR